MAWPFARHLRTRATRPARAGLVSAQAPRLVVDNPVPNAAFHLSEIGAREVILPLGQIIVVGKDPRGEYAFHGPLNA